MNRLIPFGFSSFQSSFEPHAKAGLAPGRVLAEHRGGIYVVLREEGELDATVSGKLRHGGNAQSFPAVGDWVALRGSVIQAVVPRRTAFVRAVAGGLTRAQIVAANVDVVFVVCAVDELNPRRIERYLAVTAASGAKGAVVLTKSDRAPDAALDALGSIDRPIHVVSALNDIGVDTLRPYFAADRTVAILGMSGAGKSTLVNRLLGANVQRVGDIAGDGRGQHTTTQRQLLLLPTGGVVLDTPGMRELRLWNEEDDGLDDTFADIAALGEGCRFRDCTHQREPACAVKAALEGGTLDRGRWESFAKLERERAALARRKVGAPKRR